MDADQQQRVERQREYREEREYENQEVSRQSALDAERAVWADIVTTQVQDGKPTAIAIRVADEVLAAYRERFN
jgi:hypothetical protein